MLWRLLSSAKPKTLPPLTFIFASPFSNSFLKTKIPKKWRKKRKKKDSALTKLVQTELNLIPHFEAILKRDATFRFLTRTTDFLRRQPDSVLSLDEAGKLHRELGYRRGSRALRFILLHPLLLQTYRHPDSNKVWFGFTDLMESLLEEETSIVDSMEADRVTKVRKLLMMSKHRRIPLSKIYHTRLLFGIPHDFRDRVANYPNYFRTVVEDDGRSVLELVDWDPSLAVTALEKEFVADQDKALKTFKFPVKHAGALDLEYSDVKRLNLLNTLPLVSPYSQDGHNLDLWTLEATKFRVGVLHEFLNLTLEKRAWIHHILEFKEELSLTKHTYHMLLKQPQTFYLAGTQMNWGVFLRDAYGADGVLINKDPQVVFTERLYEYAQMQKVESA